jgi:acyl-CoA thioester hydrolase
MRQTDNAMSPPEPSAGVFDGRVHSLPVRVYYEDTDFTGVIYHANYLRYFERGRSDFLRAAGINHTQLLTGEDPTAFVVNRIDVEFVRPARIDQALTVRTTFDIVAGPRLLIAQSIDRAGEELVRASVEACCITTTGRPKRPPALLLQSLKPFLAE